MHIAMIGQKGIPAIYGGVEKHVHELSSELVLAGHKVSVYSRSWYSEGVTSIVDGVRVVFTPSIHTKHLDTITHTLSSTIHALFYGYDVIHYHGVGPSLLSWIPRIFSPKTRVITTFHSIDRYHQKWGLFARFCLKLGEYTACLFAHKTITISESLTKYCAKEFHKDTVCIPHGLTQTTAIYSKEHISRFGFTPQKYLVMVSRLVPHKGAHLLIEAFRRLKKQHLNDPQIQDLKLAIVGGSVYTNQYVKQLHEQAHVCNDIVFTDFQSGDTVEALYANALALIHPSLNEGLPLTVLQAMSHGTSVLVSNIPEHLELVQDPRSIFVENDVAAIEEKIYAFLALSASEKEAMIQKNIETVHKHYAWDKIIGKIVALYEGNTDAPSFSQSTPVRPRMVS
ncbi:MAG: glycosyltransferase family 4 protein [Candidatus Magasanikbacteria bacterium]|jgi:glycosyltransferase involved in cell wall biosynthesis|nr:glycosyltransferase family 4 protein [Candidatus Magasanikbacteria bacterium]MBT4221214.1 glycosyltransferase family 4 protein [Candidatus Magasanikbacteria bacterium]MBT4350643.1 glycosyltransferase family 4 protein [Candidatus Magasanikbacteria bacterium]MBT4541357.1 glycosyltransferase family 4 protein [Candidatus Magasanikbacteria bacterium]MBT6253091.1 glycosyltransferase family 4 protein [Candidatus Magasanikbacteria bacterium]